MRGMIVRAFAPCDGEDFCRIWNRVVEDGVAFPEETPLKVEDACAFAAYQSFTAVVETEGKVRGLYILHPNGEGRKAHVANASYAVEPESRGKGLGRALVLHSLKKAKELGFSSMQFNAVVASNPARRLYESLGFQKIGCIRRGFRMKDGSLSDMYIYQYPFWDEAEK